MATHLFLGLALADMMVTVTRQVSSTGQIGLNVAGTQRQASSTDGRFCRLWSYQMPGSLDRCIVVHVIHSHASSLTPRPVSLLLPCKLGRDRTGLGVQTSVLTTNGA